MTQRTMVIKKYRERRHAVAFLSRIGEDPKRWTIDEGERPDFLLKSPAGDMIGVEITEIMTSNQGEMRTAERLVCATLQQVVDEFIKSIGVPGAYVMGNNIAIAPPHQLRIEELRQKFHEHLDAHGSGLGDPNGSMKVPFKHEWGRVTAIQRSERPGVHFGIDNPYNTPAYKGGRPLFEIESSVLDSIEKKVRKATGYSNQGSLWLAIRNPNQPVGELSTMCLEQARRLNEGRFARIVLFNDPEDVLDASPPEPHCVEIC